MLPRVCAILVTYHTKAPLDTLFSALLSQVDYVFVVDNGSPADSLAFITQAAQPYEGRIRMIINPENMGLAAAQNQAIRLALAEGFDWVLLLDEDSIPQPDMVAHMLGAQQHNNHPQVGILAPCIIEQGVATPGRYPVVHGKFAVKRQTVKPGEQLVGVITVIASGSLIHKNVFRTIGLMAEGLFIDYIDHEFCLRASQHGYKIMVVGDATLLHRQGNKSRHQILGFSVITANYSPLRRYYIFRNRMFVLRRYGRQFPFLWSYEIMAYIWDVLRILLIEPQPLSKLRGAFKGFVEGVTTSANPISGNTVTPIQ